MASTDPDQPLQVRFSQAQTAEVVRLTLMLWRQLSATLPKDLKAALLAAERDGEDKTEV